ncbi:MAG: DUF1992 domain-containing protein [Desulfatitalea sp.]|nr:DUF1992 domain-containing protein [Desulfatitalea sp.]NNK00546.1 DUF1992 domain-containing protein [Desulfatitalea sp.]
MLTGFESIVEQRIKAAQQKGAFDNLSGAGRPLDLTRDQHIPEDLRLPYKILRNADCLPPEIELKKEIQRTEELLACLPDTAQRYAVLKKLNFLIMKVNAGRTGNLHFDIPQKYLADVSDRLSTRSGGLPERDTQS